MKNIGIFAHVDAGKTTLTEQLLKYSGAIRTIGSVDKGTTHSDRMDIEKRRGISVKSTAMQIEWKGEKINLIDTPGHVDFASEVERSLWALDAAVLVISAADGVEPQSQALFGYFSEIGLPVLIFVNKMDRETADLEKTVRLCRIMLSSGVFPADNEDAAMEALAEFDEEALETFLDGKKFPKEILSARLHDACEKAKVFPLLSGSALKDIGIDAVLDAIIDWLPSSVSNSEDDAAGVVFAVEPNDKMGRCAYVRMDSGVIRNRDQIVLNKRKTSDLASFGKNDIPERKITQIRSLSTEGVGADVGILSAGEIGCVFGLGDVAVGDIIGAPDKLRRPIKQGDLRAPLVMVKVIPQSEDKRKALFRAFTDLSAEDPLIDMQEFEGQIHIRVMGTIQLEVIEDILKKRFGIEVTFGPAEIVYKETIKETAYGYAEYTWPKPCWAIIRFRIEPLPAGSGIVYSSEVPVIKIKSRYQHQIEQALPLALKQGMLGWEVDDVKITLIDGSDHQFHTHPLDFIVATPWAFLDGMRNGGSVLLEPYYRMKITCHPNESGKIMTEIRVMRGEVFSVETIPEAEMILMDAKAPVKEALDFPIRLAAMTGGRALLSLKTGGYEPCDLSLGKTSPRRGVHPLDTAKYILAARSALEGGIFDD